MNTKQRIILVAALIAAFGVGAFLWWKNYSITDKYTYIVRGSAFKINGPRSGSFAFELDVTNNFGFSGSITGYDLTVSLNDTPIAKVVSDVAVTFPQHVPVPMTISGSFDPLSSFKTLANFQLIAAAVTKPQTVLINIKGTFGIKINVKGINVPLSGLPFDTTMTLKEFLPGA